MVYLYCIFRLHENVSFVKQYVIQYDMFNETVTVIGLLLDFEFQMHTLLFFYNAGLG